MSLLTGLIDAYRARTYVWVPSPGDSWAPLPTRPWWSSSTIGHEYVRLWCIWPHMVWDVPDRTWIKPTTPSRRNMRCNQWYELEADIKQKKGMFPSSCVIKSEFNPNLQWGPCPRCREMQEPDSLIIWQRPTYRFKFVRMQHAVISPTFSQNKI